MLEPQRAESGQRATLDRPWLNRYRIQAGPKAGEGGCVAETSKDTGRRDDPAKVRARQLYLTGFICLLALWIAQPFLLPVAWAIILAIAEWPLHKRLLKRWPGWPMTIAVGLTLATALLVIFPLSIAAVALGQESEAAITWLQKAQQTGVPPPPWLGGLPLVGDRLSGWWQEHLATAQRANTMLGAIDAATVLAWVRSAAAEVAKQSGLFLVTLIILAAVLSRGERFARQADTIAERMFGDFGQDFVERMTDAVRSTVNGTLLVSFGEGALIGVGYAVAGVPQPLLFTTVTVVLALIPFGAWAAFGLASLILIGSGATLAGILLFVGAAGIMTIGDNVVQPAVICSAVELPFILAMIGAFGGLAVLGLVGLFIGPVVMVALVLVLDEWMRAPGSRKA
jgi:predicted PurR-regulated permease PerM